MNHRSLAFRLGVWYALLLGVTFALVGAAMFYGLGHYLRSSMRDTLQRRSAQIEQVLVEAPETVTSDAIGGAIALRIAPEFNNRFVRITRAPSSLIYRSGPPADRSFDPAAIPALSDTWPKEGAVRKTWTPGDRTLLIRTTPISAPSGQYLVELGISMEPIDAVQDRLLGLLAIMLPVLLIFASGGGYLLVNRALRPVDQLSRTAEQFSMQDLQSSLPVVPTGDALQRLSVSLNRMLERLRNSVQSSRRFLADASHEIRTPLTVIKGELQEIGRHEKMTLLDVRERVGSVLEEVARLEHLVSGLLTLSRLDAGEVRGARGDVDLTELATTTAEHMRLMAEDRGITLEFQFQSHVMVQGDQGQIKQIIVNLLDNAIRYTLPDGTVTLRTAIRGESGVLEVSDTGTGIPEAALPHVFDRFYRVDEARSRDAGGAGIGLSIVKSICLAHGAEIEVESSPGRGSCFRIRFPSGMVAVNSGKSRSAAVVLSQAGGI
jgi:heavy metal sensor kinase